MSTSDESLKETGKSAAAAICEMIAALECDYDRLEELRDVRENTQGLVHENDIAELKELEEAAGECTSREQAEQRIQEDALSIEVRGDWQEPLMNMNAMVEFKLLLATGGPAVRIVGELDNGEPTRAWLEVQDWGTPWTRYFDISQDTLLAYARCFYFGEG
jgi:hypothetical protein